MKKVALHTLGCKVNFAETSTLGRQFVDRGFEIVAPDEGCDIYVLNTCSVTERADRECRQIIRRVLRRSPETYVIVTGCYAQLRPGEVGSLDGVDLILGAREKFRLFDYASGFVKKTTPQIRVSCIGDPLEFEAAFSGELDGRTRAFLKIQDGCDYHCTFCTIPLARGESRSQPVSRVLEQAHHLAASGYKEIVLTGVNVGDYGRKIGTRLLELLRSLDRVEGIERFRISSIEPNLLTREMVDFILGSEKFCNHFHIPLQSGCDTLLKRMRRRYLAGEYRDLVEYIRQQDADAGIGADVIVGFPGEDKTFFDETHSFLIDLPVSYLHVFTYSERESTPAAQFSGRVQPAVRAERSAILHALGQNKRESFHSSFVGRVLPVLFETESSNGRISGLTTNYIRVETASESVCSNELYTTRIVAAAHDRCSGELFRAGVGEKTAASRVEEYMSSVAAFR